MAAAMAIVGQSDWLPMMIPTPGAEAPVLREPLALEDMLRIALWQAAEEAPQYRGQKPNEKRRFPEFSAR
jgi:hypothetical protein